MYFRLSVQFSATNLHVQYSSMVFFQFPTHPSGQWNWEEGIKISNPTGSPPTSVETLQWKYR